MISKRITRTLWIGLMAFVFAASPLSAQNCDMFKNNTRYEYGTYDKKDKLEAKVAYVITDVTPNGGGVDATMQVDLYDKKDKHQHTMTYKMQCQDGVVVVDMERFMGPETTKAFEGWDVEIQSEYITFPASASVGDALDDGQLTAKFTMEGGGLSGTVDIEATEREVIEAGALETPAGSFDTYTISERYESKIKMGPIKVKGFNMVNKTWYAPSLGLHVRTENWDKKGKKLQNYTQLLSVGQAG